MHKYDFTLITDRKICENDFFMTIEQAIEGGVGTVQLREKDLSTKDLYWLAKKLREMTRDLGVNLVINDRVDIAMAIDAEGIHLGWQSLSVNVVRKMVGKEKLIGYSAHSLEDVKKALVEGVDYVSISPVFSALSKNQFIKPLGVIEIRKIKEQVKIPVIALGGINEFNVKEVMKNGADGIAVISAIFLSKNPKQTACKIFNKIKNVRHYQEIEF
ncbi:MAG: thiamine phosphate synthase [Candidatus Scalindua sp.]|nr:thiamine phosphate synthase [Candidatus Scalindua sp.]